MTFAAVRFKAVFLLLLIHCLLSHTLFVGVSVLGCCFVMQYLLSFSSFAIILLGKNELHAVALFVALWMQCRCYCFLPLPR